MSILPPKKAALLCPKPMIGFLRSLDIPVIRIHIIFYFRRDSSALTPQTPIKED